MPAPPVRYQPRLKPGAPEQVMTRPGSSLPRVQTQQRIPVRQARPANQMAVRDAVTGKPFSKNPNLKGNAQTRTATKAATNARTKTGTRTSGKVAAASEAFASTQRAIASNLAGAGLNIALMRGAFTAQDVYDKTIGAQRAKNEKAGEAFRARRSALNKAAAARIAEQRAKKPSAKSGRKAGF